MSSTILEVISTSLPGLLHLQKQTQPKNKKKNKEMWRGSRSYTSSKSIAQSSVFMCNLDSCGLQQLQQADSATFLHAFSCPPYEMEFKYVKRLITVHRIVMVVTSAGEIYLTSVECFCFFLIFCAVPFNAIVLGLGHMQASGDGAAGPIGDVTDKMDLVEMMLDCAETMASVLDDVTDMG